MTVLVAVSMMLNSGAMGACAAQIAQKPPLREYWSTLITPASGWPMVPVTA